MAKREDKTIDLDVIEGVVLGVRVLRGYAKLCDLARMSRPDIYDQKTNVTGTQRDLSPKHAREAYEYVKNHDLAYWPEVFLCVRESSVIKFSKPNQKKDVGVLTIEIEKAEKAKDICISRVDGNHRLHYADGKAEGFDPLEKKVSFCLAPDLMLEQEIALFRDINDNQMRMNTSHLDNIEIRLTPEERLKSLEPELYIANKFSKDSESPLFGIVYEGGKKPAGLSVPLRSLVSGLRYMLVRPTKLNALNDPDAQYKVIKNYFLAFKKWEPEAWEDYKNHIPLRGAGLWAVCFLGAEVIDRALAKGKFKPDDMLQILKTGRSWDWSNKGDFQGYSGRGGAVKISEIIVGELQDESGVSVKSLFKKIMDD